MINSGFTKLSVILFLAQITICAQNTSTYTRTGIGDMKYSYSARTLGMGHSGSALINNDYVEILNPASWSALSRTRIEFSFTYDAVTLSNSSESNYFGDGDFKGFTFGFPVSSVNGIGIAFGIVPYSRINYQLEQYFEATPEVNSSYTNTYRGKGGLSKLFLGGSYQLPFSLILGATLDYYVGNIKYTSTSEFDNTSFLTSEYELSYANKGFGTTLGLISPDFASMFNSESISNFRFAVSANIIGELTSDTLLISTSSSTVDTLGIGETQMNVPIRILTGTSITFSNSYTLALDYYFQLWSEYNFDDKYSSNLKDLHRVSLGFEYRPVRVPGLSFLELIMLRAGLSYEMSQYKFNNTDINQFGVFGGFSLPLSPENSIDFGIEYSIRGTTENNLTKENFLRINLGISFGDLWFETYEY